MLLDGAPLPDSAVLAVAVAVAYVPGLVLLTALAVPPGLLMVALAPAASVAVAGVVAVLVAPVGLPFGPVALLVATAALGVAAVLRRARRSRTKTQDSRAATQDSRAATQESRTRTQDSPGGNAGLAAGARELRVPAPELRVSVRESRVPARRAPRSRTSVPVLVGAVMVAGGVGFAAWSWLSGIGPLATRPQEHDMIMHVLQTAYVTRTGRGAPWQLAPVDLLTGTPTWFYPSGVHLLAAATAPRAARCSSPGSRRS